MTVIHDFNGIGTGSFFIDPSSLTFRKGMRTSKMRFNISVAELDAIRNAFVLRNAFWHAIHDLKPFKHISSFKVGKEGTPYSIGKVAEKCKILPDLSEVNWSLTTCLGFGTEATLIYCDRVDDYSSQGYASVGPYACAIQCEWQIGRSGKMIDDSPDAVLRYVKNRTDLDREEVSILHSETKSMYDFILECEIDRIMNSFKPQLPMEKELEQLVSWIMKPTEEIEAMMGLLMFTDLDKLSR